MWKWGNQFSITIVVSLVVLLCSPSKMCNWRTTSQIFSRSSICGKIRIKLGLLPQVSTLSTTVSCIILFRTIIKSLVWLRLWQCLQILIRRPRSFNLFKKAFTVQSHLQQSVLIQLRSVVTIWTQMTLEQSITQVCSKIRTIALEASTKISYRK